MDPACACRQLSSTVARDQTLTRNCVSEAATCRLRQLTPPCLLVQATMRMPCGRLCDLLAILQPSMVASQVGLQHAVLPQTQMRLRRIAPVSIIEHASFGLMVWNCGEGRNVWTPYYHHALYEEGHAKQGCARLDCPEDSCPDGPPTLNQRLIGPKAVQEKQELMQQHARKRRLRKHVRMSVDLANYFHRKPHCEWLWRAASKAPQVLCALCCVLYCLTLLQDNPMVTDSRAPGRILLSGEVLRPTHDVPGTVPFSGTVPVDERFMWQHTVVVNAAFCKATSSPGP